MAGFIALLWAGCSTSDGSTRMISKTLMSLWTTISPLCSRCGPCSPFTGERLLFGHAVTIGGTLVWTAAVRVATLSCTVARRVPLLAAEDPVAALLSGGASEGIMMLYVIDVSTLVTRNTWDLQAERRALICTMPVFAISVRIIPLIATSWRVADLPLLVSTG